MVVTLTNPTTNAQVVFQDGLTYTELFQETNPVQDINVANLNNTYRLLNGSPYGITTNPTNNNLLIQGIDEDGSDFYNNYYSSRIITIVFDIKQSTNLNHLNAVLYMTNELLRMDITTETANYTAFVAVNGGYENGILELIANSIFFDLNELNYSEFSLTGSPYTFLPLQLPQAFFGAPDLNGYIYVNTPVPTDCVYTFNGSFNTITISNVSTGTVFKVPVTVGAKLIVDTQNKNVVADNLNVTNLCSGIYPSLITGNNNIFLQFVTRTTSIFGTCVFNKKVFAVI